MRVALERGYYVEFLHHPERNITVDDLIHGSESDGWRFIKCTWHEERQRYRYKIKTTDIEGEELTLIVEAFPEYKRIQFITAW